MPRKARTLKEAYDALVRAPFPSHPKSQDLAEWREELAEMDSFYAGIAATALAGGPVNHYLWELNELEVTLASIVPLPDDAKAFDQCRHRLELLKEVRERLQNS